MIYSALNESSCLLFALCTSLDAAYTASVTIRTVNNKHCKRFRNSFISERELSRSLYAIVRPSVCL